MCSNRGGNADLTACLGGLRRIFKNPTLTARNTYRGCIILWACSSQEPSRFASEQPYAAKSIPVLLLQMRKEDSST